ncbi:hypothetical protein MG293_014444 [Ovis ammon polii]|uniref:Uncharacterized protein n=1 Tax=Ovis ammon polii TaxID=230172 RepID=A0AAD4TVE9_OVIAM|nr:hypothetical protein MG293_014444 [Ovis ammon polii]
MVQVNQKSEEQYSHSDDPAQSLTFGGYAITMALYSLAVAAVPAVLGAVGFTGAGIAASSLAAKMMSAAAVANGGGVAAGSLVATLQSVGAAGLSTSSNILLGSVGSAFGALLGGARRAPPSPPPGGPRPAGEQPGENVPQVEPPKPPLRPEKHEK